MMPHPISAAILCNGIPRWDFSLGCPNKAGALAACVLVLLLGLMLKSKSKVSAWTLCILSCAGGFALVHTFSRGGIAAFLTGAAVLLAASFRSGRLKERALHLCVVSAFIVSAVFHLGFASRIAQGVPGRDASVDNRLVIWKTVPRMIADAPDGWGAGQAGNAYMNWYQPPGMNERYRTLVSSPLTFLAETGNAGRLCALFLAFALAGVLLAHLAAKKDPLPLAVWTAFSVASVFSTVAEEKFLWLVPLLTLLPVRHAPKRIFIFALAGAAVSAAAIHAAAHFTGRNDPPLKYERGKGRLTIGNGGCVKWLVHDDQTIGTVESGYGRALRAWYEKHEGKTGAAGIVFTPASLPANAERVILCGANAKTGILKSIPESVKEIRVLSPADPDSWLHLKNAKVRIYCGELADNQPMSEDDAVTFIPGDGDHLTEWPRLAFGVSDP